MRHLTAGDVHHVKAADGHLSLTAYGCGCCADSYTTDTWRYTPDWSIEVDELAKLVGRLEDELDALKAYLKGLQNAGVSTFVHVDED